MHIPPEIVAAIAAEDEPAPMTLPTIHPNGTPKRMLMDGLMTVHAALDAVYGLMRQCAPNGRDYYPQGPEAFDKAFDEHLRRMQKLVDATEAWEAYMNAVADL